VPDLAPELVLETDHDRLIDIGMALEHQFDLWRLDVVVTVVMG
jgi:hypothetical protein